VGDELLGSFKDKVTTIKTTVATFFAKIDEMVTANAKETKSVSKQFNNFQADFVNPAQELDGKVHGMNVKIAASEQVREA
jgi:hypothetical protein